MKNETLYNKTVNILVDAYFNDTLQHTNCLACAVGNLVAANKGIRLFKAEDGNVESVEDRQQSIMWYKAVGGVGVYERALSDPEVIDQIKCTGYSAKEIQLIENAFESTVINEDSDDEDGFEGLMKVIEVLDQIHENTDQQVTQSSKQKFVKA